jgi:transglutaminase-like putative cysteine protease
MLNRLTLLITIVILLTTGCSGKHLITDRRYRQQVHRDFIERSNVASNRKENLYNIFNSDLSVRQTEALEFLYAYMPLSDLAEYSGEFFLAGAEAALKARHESRWGKLLPYDIFLHYVLPVRVNNENLDSFRIAYFSEISNRVKGLGIKEAALEINHWCHEKVAYQPSDIRTSSPINTILSARGRCGEESTFTVSALRTAGIPARQVYCPRWAHTDDNHAWVEIWIDGQWYYMGACEPEPVLDRGWFTEPARRAMLVHTKSFGAPSGNENYITCSKYYSVVNDLSKYAITKKIQVKVEDASGQPVKNAVVEYQLYNYSEFYPLAQVPTDEKGFSYFETGLGDLLIWARSGNNFNFRKVTVAETDTLLLKLNRVAEGTSCLEYDLVPPVKPVPLQGPPEEMVRENAKRLDEENGIRLKYISTWMQPCQAITLAAELKTDTGITRDLLLKSMGNYRAIAGFLKQTPDSLRKIAMALLGVVSEKDLRDAGSTILADHIRNLRNPYHLNTTDDMFVNYVLNPRVANEMLTSYKGYLLRTLPSDLVAGAPDNPVLIEKYIESTVRIAEGENYYGTPLTPAGVNKLGVSDLQSRSIYFVSICRTLGIPARLERGSNNPQFNKGNEWHDIYFARQELPPPVKGYIRFSSKETDPVPEYYINFTLARFSGGRYNTLEYDFNRKVYDFRDEIALIPGHYLLITGNRLDDDKILTSLSFFDLRENQHLNLDIKLRK